MQKRCRRIGHARLVRIQKRLHAAQLSCNRSGPLSLKRLLGIGKVRHDVDNSNTLDCIDFINDFASLLRQETQAVHAGIDFDVNLQIGVRDSLQQLNLPTRMHHGFHAVGFELLNIGGVEKAFDHQNALGPSRGTRTLRFSNFDQSQTVCLGKAFHCVFQNMAVGVCLHHGPKGAPLRRFAHALEVMLKSLDVYQNGNGSGH